MQRHGSDGSAVIRLRSAGLILLIAHLVLVAWLTLRPRDVMWVTAANLEPLAGIKADLAMGPLEAARRIGEGLLLLAPLGVLLPMAGGRLAVSPWGSLARTVLAGALVSLGIELLQTAVPGRVVDVDALLLNTTGVALAHLAVVPAWRGRLRRRQGPDGGRGRGSAGGGSHGRGAGALRVGALRDDVSQGATPRIPRVGIAP
ncbi:VanZ family protein [Streptomyces sp. WAC05374]|uniref:VanZ family protein n=1 Tax=Streptomyces sp. WAC05374 TaxID=2487420 RepID=UPI001054C057|nr:VanZ family protein [Streptomyces sp. WAC05374]TDF43157.1 VanZ family protein [Streptomyces sp. WAC05374]TDF50944.1 VanZ family protein [Streptomyces sp. WAC05374]TDF52313.1 VanZ family protein [Streptomyces sp. WAC05374]